MKFNDFDDGFNPCDINNDDDIDRTVPNDENYYGRQNQIDYNFNSRSNRNIGEVEDNQFKNNNYDYDNFNQQRQRNLRPDSERDIMSNSSRRGSPNNHSGGSHKGQKKKRRKSSPFKTIIAILLILVVIIGLMGNSVLSKINYEDKEDNQSVSADELTSSSDVKNILLLGIDRRSTDEETSRSDTMMLISIDKKNNCIKLTSFLRDTWLYIPSHEGKQRLNAACTYGGYSGVCDTIEYNFGVKVDGYVVADFDMFKIIVDAIGGVEVEVSEAEANEVTKHKKRYGNVTLEEGTYNLTGEQALAYCRIRKIDSDFMRTQRQRTVMTAIMSGVKTTNPISLYKMANDIAPYVETDLTKTELMKLATSALPCIGTIYQTKVPMTDTWSYATINGNSVISIDVDANKEKLIDYIYVSDGSEYAED